MPDENGVAFPKGGKVDGFGEKGELKLQPNTTNVDFNDVCSSEISRSFA
jgi:hypothetical protein